MSLINIGSKSHQVWVPESGAIQARQSKEDTERNWRDSELLRTDKLIVLPDFPKDLTSYRAELREYPSQPDFPNGTRPVEGG